MGFQDVAFQHSLATLYTRCVKNCCKGESPWAGTCLRSVLVARKGMIPVEYFRSNKYICENCYHLLACLGVLNIYYFIIN